MSRTETFPVVTLIDNNLTFFEMYPGHSVSALMSYC